jgi:molecular chaperone DnaJ
MPKLQRNGHGDLYVIVRVSVPKKLKSEEKEALLDYAKISGEDISKYRGKESFLDKIIDKLKG